MLNVQDVKDCLHENHKKKAISQKRIPIIAMTAHSTDECKTKCLEMGMDSFLTKPIQRASLFQVLSSIIHQKNTCDLSGTPNNNLLNAKHAEDQQTLPEILPGIEIHKIMNALNMDYEMYRERLSDFYLNNKDIMKTIWEAYDCQNWSQLNALSHSIKCSGLNIGAIILHKRAWLLERESRFGNVISPAEETVMNIEKVLDQVLASIRSLQKMERHESVEAVKIMRLLKNFAVTLKSFEPVQVEQGMVEIKKCIEASVTEKLEALIDNYDYDNALDTLKDISERIIGVQL